MFDKTLDETLTELTDIQMDDVSGGAVPFFVAAIFLASANLGYQIGRDVAKR